MNRHCVVQIVLKLKDDLQIKADDSELFDDMCRAEKLFGTDIPVIYDCMEETRNYGGTIRRNAQIIIDLLERELAEQATLSFDLAGFQINDIEFCKLVEQSFQFYKEGKVDIATEKIWDAFERIKTYFRQYSKRESADKVLDIISRKNEDFKAMLTEEFTVLTKLGNEFRIRHHETDKKDICCAEHYDYLFTRCLSVLKLAASILNEVILDEV